MRMIGIFLFGWAAHIMIFTVTHMILISVAKPAHALSCMPLNLNKAAIESHELIFEGVVTDVKSAGLAHKLKGTKLKRYEFKIEKHWYGQNYKAGQNVTIFAPPGWERETAYKQGERVIVFAKLDKEFTGNDQALVTHPGWCGFDTYGIDHNRKFLSAYKDGTLGDDDNVGGLFWE